MDKAKNKHATPSRLPSPVGMGKPRTDSPAHRISGSYVSVDTVVRPMAQQLSSLNIANYAAFLRTVARERRTLSEVLADAQLFAQAWREHSAVLDKEARLGLARSHDLLVLLAAAMRPATRCELEAKHDALAGVQGLDPATTGLNLVVNAALSADWTRFEDVARREALASLDPIAH